MLFVESSGQARKHVGGKFCALLWSELPKMIGKVRLCERTVHLEVAVIPWGQLFLGHIRFPDMLREFRDMFSFTETLYVTQKPVETHDAPHQRFFIHGSSSNSSSKRKGGSPRTPTHSVHKIADDHTRELGPVDAWSIMEMIWQPCQQCLYMKRTIF